MYPYPYYPYGNPPTNPGINPSVPPSVYPFAYPYYSPPGYPPVLPSTYPVPSPPSSLPSYPSTSLPSQSTTPYYPSTVGSTATSSSVFPVPPTNLPPPGYPPVQFVPNSSDNTAYSQSSGIYSTNPYIPHAVPSSSSVSSYSHTATNPHTYHPSSQRYTNNHQHSNPRPSAPPRGNHTDNPKKSWPKAPSEPKNNTNHSSNLNPLPHPSKKNHPQHHHHNSTVVSINSTIPAVEAKSATAVVTTTTSTDGTTAVTSSSSSSSSSYTCCNKTFSTERDFLLHKSFHIPCPIENCAYEGIRNRLGQHLHTVHRRKIEEFGDTIPKLPVPVPKKDGNSNPSTTNPTATTSKNNKQQQQQPKENNGNKEGKNYQLSDTTEPVPASNHSTLSSTESSSTSVGTTEASTELSASSSSSKKSEDFPVERDQYGNIIIPSSLERLIPPQYRRAAQIGNTEEEIARWRAERKRNFPTESNIVNKQQRIKHQQESGQWSMNPDTGRMKLPNSNKRARTEATASTTLSTTDNGGTKTEGADTETKHGEDDDGAPEELTSTVNALVQPSNTKHTNEGDETSGSSSAAFRNERSRDNPPKQEICRRFRMGNCRNGNHCPYLHHRHPGHHTNNSVATMDNYNGLIQPVPHSSLSRSLLHKLLAKDIEQETSIILQCLTYIVRNNFLQDSSPSSSSAAAATDVMSSSTEPNGTVSIMKE